MNRNIEATKCYIRVREDMPETELHAVAFLGFRELGVETATFAWSTDLETVGDLGPTVCVSGYIDDVHASMRTLGIPMPPDVDYPDELVKFLGRDIVATTLGAVRDHPGQARFIKPLENKMFTGFVWNGDASSRRQVVTHGDETPVFSCEPVTFVSEYRCFILDNEILDVRRYKGDWSKAPSRKIVEAAVDVMSTNSNTPRAYGLDWGITDDGRTLLVEMNDGYSMGTYGLKPVFYAHMLSARWHQMTSR